MFYNWLASPRERRIFGIQCPITRRLGCFVTTPMGFAPVPGINDENVKAILRVVMKATERDILEHRGVFTSHFGDKPLVVEESDFVDDFRFVIPDE